MHPSGLIFLVIIAIWATYLLQHWVRRREHLATARSVDRFSDAMRVLERRIPLPEFDLSAPQPRSYAVSPARPSRSEVVVKRAHATTSRVSTAPATAVSAPRRSRGLAGRSARRARGLSLLLALSFVLVASPLAAFSVLPWWGPVAAAAALMVDLAWLRHAAVAERANRRAKASAHRATSAVRRTAAPRSTTRAVTQPAARSSVHSEPVIAAPVTVVAEVAEPIGSLVGADLSGWAPVPVPPPTYTLKAKAERPEPAPPTVTAPVPAQLSSFEGLVEEDELDGLLDRRAAGA